MLSWQTDFSGLQGLLQVSPVLGDVHPLVPLCLESGVQVIDYSRGFLALSDEKDYLCPDLALIINADPVLQQRLPRVCSLAHPPVDVINRNMKHHLDYIREHLLTNHKVATVIEEDVSRNHYDIVVVLLVDGLAYGDVLDWPVEVEACFVDGPSVTFRAANTPNTLLSSVGFPAIVGNPSVADRLVRLGYQNFFGYTYWHARDNIVAQYMFRGIPDSETQNFQAILRILDDSPLAPRSYIQIVREGLDGLAHSKRELRRAEVQGALLGLYDDIERLVNLVQRKAPGSAIFITADHGVLWKSEHDWEVVTCPGSKPRYTTEKPQELLMDYVVRFEPNGVPFYLFTYPYLGTPIRRNDSGVHGGLSYQESFVPFIKIEV